MSGRAALQTRPFLDRGADIDAFNDKGQTSVHGAAALGSNSIVTFLAEHGARLTTRDKQGRTPPDVMLVPEGRPGGWKCTKTPPHSFAAWSARSKQSRSY